MRYLGIDLGSKTVGLAMSDPTATIASSFKTIFFSNEDYKSTIPEIKQIVTDYNIKKIILGLPKNMNNTLGERAEITLKYKELLEENISVPVELLDERLTSVISNSILIEADISRKKRKKKVDSIALSLFHFIYKIKMNKENTFKIIDKDGKEIEFEILFTFESDETNKNYMVYTDNTTDEEGNTKVYASVFNPNAEPLELLPVETEREWKVIETIITSIEEENKKNNETNN